MTKLQAVNEMLEAIKEFPASALDTGGTSIVALAESVLDRETERVLSRGWHENTDHDVELTPTAGEIEVPADAISVDTYGRDEYRDVVARDGKLYDKATNTDDQFTDPIRTVIIRRLDFENCSTELQTLIVKQASLMFHRRQIGGQVQDAFLQQELDAAFRTMSRADAERADHNVLDTQDASYILGRNVGSQIR